MAQEVINIGSALLPSSSDTIRRSFEKVNSNFTELFYLFSLFKSNFAQLNDVISPLGCNGVISADIPGSALTSRELFTTSLVDISETTSDITLTSTGFTINNVYTIGSYLLSVYDINTLLYVEDGEVLVPDDSTMPDGFTVTIVNGSGSTIGVVGATSVTIDGATGINVPDGAAITIVKISQYIWKIISRFGPIVIRVDVGHFSDSSAYVNNSAKMQATAFYHFSTNTVTAGTNLSSTTASIWLPLAVGNYLNSVWSLYGPTVIYNYSSDSVVAGTSIIANGIDNSAGGAGNVTAGWFFYNYYYLSVARQVAQYNYGTNTVISGYNLTLTSIDRGASAGTSTHAIVNTGNNNNFMKYTYATNTSITTSAYAYSGDGMAACGNDVIGVFDLGYYAGGYATRVYTYSTDTIVTGTNLNYYAFGRGAASNNTTLGLFALGANNPSATSLITTTNVYNFTTNSVTTGANLIYPTYLNIGVTLRVS